MPEAMSESGESQSEVSLKSAFFTEKVKGGLVCLRQLGDHVVFREGVDAEE